MKITITYTSNFSQLFEKVHHFTCDVGQSENKILILHFENNSFQLVSNVKSFKCE